MNGIVAPLFSYQRGVGNTAKKLLDDFGATMEMLEMNGLRMRRYYHMNDLFMQAIKACAKVKAPVIDVVLIFQVNPSCEDYSDFFEVREQDKLYGKDVIGRRWSEFASVYNYVQNRDTDRLTVSSHFDCIIRVVDAIVRPRWHAPFEDSELDSDIFKSPTMFGDKLTEAGLSGLVSLFARGEMPDNLNDIVDHIGGVSKLEDLMAAYAEASSAERAKYSPIVNQLVPLLSVLTASKPNTPKAPGMGGFTTHRGDAMEEFTSDDFPDNGIKVSEP